MKVEIVNESGYDQALYGLFLSYAVDGKEFDAARMAVVAEKLKTRLNGEDKFLRMISVWAVIDAPLFWWSQFDTYKVGTVAQSESTMHTIKKRDLTYSDFESAIPARTLDWLNCLIMIKTTTISELKNNLPSGFLQKRMVLLNYAVLKAIINGRAHHRLPQWHQFIVSIYNQVQHPELLPERKE
jgi:hypothetical protein